VLASIGGSVSSARRADGLVGRLVLRRRRRVGDHRRRVAGLVELRRQHARDAVLLAQRVADLLQRGLVAALGSSTASSSGALKPGRSPA
jgi:hypothetical protein